jgi:UPF0716 protein FxsA
MPMIVFLSLLALPFAELFVLIKLGGAFGALPLIAALVLKGLAGALLLWWLGEKSMRRAMQDLSAGREPVGTSAGLVSALIAGIALVTPSLIVTVCMIPFLVPAVRRSALRWMLEHAGVVVFRSQHTRTAETAEEIIEPRHPSGGRGPAAAQGPVIEGEFERLEERTIRRDGDGGGGASPWAR